MNESVLGFLVSGMLPDDVCKDKEWRTFLEVHLKPARDSFREAVHAAYRKPSVPAGKGIDLSGMPRKKADKLEHYSKRDAMRFTQIDVFLNVGEGDDVIEPDRDGDAMFQSVTTELMSGAVPVRVLIVPGTTRADVVRALRKVSDWVQQEPGLLI